MKKISVWVANDLERVKGYIDGYVCDGRNTYAIVCIPTKKQVIKIEIEWLFLKCYEKI